MFYGVLAISGEGSFVACAIQPRTNPNQLVLEMSRSEPELPQPTIQGLPSDFAQPDVPREGTVKTGQYSTPFDVFRGHKPTPEESVAAKHANSAFNRYWVGPLVDRGTQAQSDRYFRVFSLRGHSWASSHR
jgi:hypothetical protein